MIDHLSLKTTIMTNNVKDIVISEEKRTSIAFIQLYSQNFNFLSWKTSVGDDDGLRIYR